MSARQISKSALTKNRKVVFERDNWTCQDCGIRIPPTRPEEASGRYAPTTAEGGGRQLELDHIVPHELGGLFLPENLRALCSKCNNKKGASTEFAGWGERIQRAQQILASGTANEKTARRAVLALMGRTA